MFWSYLWEVIGWVMATLAWYHPDKDLPFWTLGVACWAMSWGYYNKAVADSTAQTLRVVEHRLQQLEQRYVTD